MSEELTRFPITPEERHRTARSFDDVQAVPEENLPRQEDHPQDKPLPPTADTADDEDDAANGNAHNDGGRRRRTRGGGDRGRRSHRHRQ